MDFDPDAYLAAKSQQTQQSSSGFDPDAYLKAKGIQPSQGFSFNEAVKNIPSSALKFGESLGTTVTHPVQTGMGLVRTAAGGIGALTDKVVPGSKDVLTTPQDQQAWEGFKNFLSQRYGSVDALKKTVQNDPVGFAGDVASVFGGAGGAIGKAGELSDISKVSEAGSLVSKVGELANPINIARGTARVVGEYVGKPALKGLEGLSGIYGNAKGALQAEFEHPTTILSPGKESVSKMYEAAKTEPINSDLEDIAQKTDYVDAALKKAQAGTLNEESALSARQELDKVKNRVSAPYYQKARGILDDIAKEKFQSEDAAYVRAKQAEAMRNILPINKSGEGSLGRLVLGGAGAHYLNPFTALAVSPAAQGIGVGLLGAASKAASPIAQLLIDHPELLRARGLSESLNK